MKHYKAIIMVISGGGGVYDQLNEVIRQTWAKDVPEDCKVLYYYGYKNCFPKPEEGKSILYNDDIILCGNQDSWANQLLETLIAYKFVEENFSFDYIFRCCSGSYVNILELLKFLEDKPKENFYCGAFGDTGTQVYASGSGYFISRDCLRMMIDSKDEILDDYETQGHKHEDVQTGRFFSQKNIYLDNRAKRIDDPVLKDGNYHWHVCKSPAKIELIYRLLNQCKD